MPDVVFRFNHASCEAMMEINTYPLPIENDLLKLFAEIKKHTTLVTCEHEKHVEHIGSLKNHFPFSGCLIHSTAQRQPEIPLSIPQNNVLSAFF